MANDNVELTAEMSIQAFNLKIISITGSTMSPLASINLKATGPAGQVEITSLKYSLDNATFYDITLDSPPAGMLITASELGSVTTLLWDLGADFGVAFFNKNIYVQAVMSDGSHVSGVATGMLFIQKRTISPRDRRDSIDNLDAVGRNVSFGGLKSGN